MLPLDQELRALIGPTPPPKSRFTAVPVHCTPTAIPTPTAAGKTVVGRTKRGQVVSCDPGRLIFLRRVDWRADQTVRRRGKETQLRARVARLEDDPDHDRRQGKQRRLVL